MHIEELLDNSHKFYNCQHRSENEGEFTIKRCSCQGGDYQIKGYECYKRSIIDVTTSICSECQEYEPKK
ncbi:MAG: hypothetical protein RIQ48_745 [Pseudomonadota bacterium]|jgi:hypothetical protein